MEGCHLEDVTESGIVGGTLAEGVQLRPGSDGADIGILEEGLGPAIGHQIVLVGLVETAVGSSLVVGEDVAGEALYHLIGGRTVLLLTSLVGRKDVGHHLGYIGAGAKVIVLEHFLGGLLGVGIAVGERLGAGHQAHHQDQNGKDGLFHCGILHYLLFFLPNFTLTEKPMLRVDGAMNRSIPAP